MKNHWLDKKVDREIDDAFANINLSLDTVDMSNDRYELYGCLDLNDMEENDRAAVTEILLKYKDRPQWINEVLTDVGYVLPYGGATQDHLGNLTINVGGFAPGGDGITLGEVKTSEFGQICPNCNTEMWPCNTATTMQQGDPMCACSNSCANLDIFYPVDTFIQNEKLQVREDNGHITQYQTTYTPVVAATMTGTIYPTPGNTSYGYVFYVSASGEFNFTRFVQSDGKVEYANGSDDPWKKCNNDDAMSLQKIANTDFYDKFMGWYDEVYSDKTTLNLQTGILEIHNHMGQCPEIVVSYEYGRDC